MIILHGGMNDEWMLLWAEQSPDELRPEGNRDPVVNEHPYCAGPEKMVNVLAHAAPGLRANSGETISATVWAAQQERQARRPVPWWRTRPDLGPNPG